MAGEAYHFWRSCIPRTSFLATSTYTTYLIEYTPTIPGTYTPEISIAGGKLTSEATVGGITILPASVTTPVETDKVGSPGLPHAFSVTAVDQDGRFVGSYMPGRIVTTVVAIPDPRADVGNSSERFIAVTQTAVEEPGGQHRVVGSFTPDVSGLYVVKALFLKPYEVWDPVANLSGYTRLALGDQVEEVLVGPSDTLDGDHRLTTNDHVVVSVFFPGTVDPRMTSISGKGFEECTAGTQCSFEIISRDSFGNKRFHVAMDEWQVSMTTPSGTSLAAEVEYIYNLQRPPSEPTLSVTRTLVADSVGERVRRRFRSTSMLFVLVGASSEGHSDRKRP